MVGRDFLMHSLEGYNCCIFAYGQTGSGKTYSMSGTKDEPGLVPRICRALFREIEIRHSNAADTATVHVSYFEIYNEAVKDLLAADTEDKPTLKVRERPKEGPYLENLSVFQVKSYGDVEAFMRMGNKARSTASTLMNETSSRSHAVFTITIRRFTKSSSKAKTTEKLSQFRLVDLAGSERAHNTGATGTRLREGGNINKSLTTLGRVISALSTGSKSTSPSKIVIPYRDSVLTYLLKDSLGGNSKTTMVACLSPADYEESLSTLRYAEATKKIKTRAVINETRNISDKEYALLREQLREMNEKIKEREQVEGVLVGDLADYRQRTENLYAVIEETKAESDARLHALQVENDAMRAHLRLLLDEVRNPIRPHYLLSNDADDDAISTFYASSEQQSEVEWGDVNRVLLSEIAALRLDVSTFRTSVSHDVAEYKRMSPGIPV